MCVARARSTPALGIAACSHATPPPSSPSTHSAGVRFAVWLLIGTLIYVFYGLRHSKAVVFAPRVPGGRNSEAAGSFAKLHADG